MKKLKKSLALLLSLLLALTMALPVMAAGNNTLTITSKTGGHTYQAYQVFAGDFFEGTLSNVTWGSGVDGTALLTALKADPTVGTSFTDCTDAEDVAKKLTDETTFGDNSEKLDAVADVIGKHLSTVMTESTETPGGNAAKGYTYTITGLADGYYFVKDEDDSITEEGNAYTKFMLQVVGNTTVAAKADAPSIDKKIDVDNDGTGDFQTSSESIGDSVHFVVESKVPNMDGYEKYYFVVKDTLSKGLTFNDDIVIQIGTETLVKDTDYEVETFAQGEETTVEIVLKNFIQYKDQTDAAIKITYSATLNEKAVIGTAGNKNSVQLTYSNNPNVEESGNPGDKPGPDSPVGETPSSDTYTYVTGVKLTKVGPDGTTTLKNAKFKIEGTSLGVVLVNEKMFKESAAGTYYRLKDGTYTETDPTGDTSDYDDITKKYEKVTVVNKETVKTDITAEGYVNAEGVLTFEGLGVGEYTITELAAPDGYNLLPEPIQITISCQYPNLPSNGCTWEVNGGNAAVNNGMIELKVVNEKGTELPSTGGVGTTLFYVIGGVMMAGAAVLLITRRRMKDSEE